MVTGALALAGILVLRDQAEYVYDRLVHEALPLVLLSAACGVADAGLLALRRPAGTRLLGAGGRDHGHLGLGVAQWPYMLPRDADGGSRRRPPRRPLHWVIVVFGIALVLVVPLLALLYVLDQRSRLEEEGEAGPG